MTNIMSGLQSFGELSATESISGERASFHSSLCRVESGPPDQGYWAPGVGALAGLDRWTVLPATFCHGSKSTCYVLAGQGGADHPCSEGGGCQEDSGDADGEEMRRDTRAQWMASLAGPGWARRGGCHRMLV